MLRETTRPSFFVGGAAALLAQAVFLVACGGGNAPSTMNVMTSGTAGSSASGAAGAGPAAGAAGAAVSSGAAGAGPTTGAAGAPATTGAGGAAGASAAGSFSPNCAMVPVTAGGMAPAKAVACTPADTQLCYKTCGPESIGFKSETCTNGAYVEQSGCSFPADMDYSCFKIPAALDASCPAMPPQASQPCTVAACTPCNAGGNYLDSTGASKAGYCVCPAAAGSSGTRKWSCASGTAWPCPSGKGC